MNLCASGHDEICFEGRLCPLCEQIREESQNIQRLQDDLADARQTIAQLEKEVADLEAVEPVVLAIEAVQKVIL